MADRIEIRSRIDAQPLSLDEFKILMQMQQWKEEKNEWRNRFLQRAAVIIGTYCVLLGCQQADQPLFSHLPADQTGIDFVNLNTETESANIFSYEYFYNGGGVAVGDINNDGLADLYFTSNNHDNKLYLNKGNFRFDDVTIKSGTACPKGWKTGVTMVDVNGDGWLDIYVSRSAHARPDGRRNILLINNHDLTFTDKASEFGLDDDSFSTHAAFFDYDRDGDLDAFLLNHSLLHISNSFDISLRNTNKRHPHVGNKLLRNENGKFVDVSDTVGVFGPASNYGLGVSLADINNDGWIDIYTGCDYTGRDRLLLNVEGKSFLDATDSLLSHLSKFTMGTDIADFNGDGLMDIYTLDMLPEDNFRQKQLMGSDRYDAYAAMVKNGLHSQYMRNILHLNNGNGTFSEIGQLAGVSNTDWSWAPLFADFDNDGIQDLFVSNGFKRDLTDNDFAKYKAFQEIVTARSQGKRTSFIEVIGKFTENKIPNYIYKGNGDLTFSDLTEQWGLGHPTLTNGAAYADLDNDGDLDLVLNNVNDRAGIYRNNAEKLNNHFLSIVIAGEGNNSAGTGTRVELIAGDRRITRELMPSRGFQSSVDPVLHFGLGNHAKADSVIIRWPSGERRLLVNLQADQRTSISADDGVPFHDVKADPATLFLPVPEAIGFRHRENDYIDFRIQALLPRMYSNLGPALAIADINRDGLTDLYVGAAKGQSAAIFVQRSDGSYTEKSPKLFSEDRLSEEVDAEFFDMDNDGDRDLYVASGGYEFALDDDALRHRLYENDGNGNFKQRQLPDYKVSASCVRPVDVDSDGDTDLFVGGRIVPGRYPESPESFILFNDGKGNFTISTIPDALRYAGMVTDAAWIDVNNDAQKDLILAGEWMPLRVFINREGKLSEESSQHIPEGTNGFWNTLLAEDFDRDGDIDIAAGNIGLNSQMKISVARPATLYYHDFDNNSAIDPILSYFIGDKSYPYPTRDELLEQLPAFKKRFTDYRSYSTATIDQVLTPEELQASRKLHATEARTTYFQNDGGKFTMKPLPVELQFAPVFAMVAMDVNEDGHTDIISGGNLSGTRSRTGKMTGNTGFVFIGDGKGNFQFISPKRTGLRLPGDVRKMKTDGTKLITTINDGPLQVYNLVSNAQLLTRKSD